MPNRPKNFDVDTFIGADTDSSAVRVSITAALQGGAGDRTETYDFSIEDARSLARQLGLAADLTEARTKRKPVARQG